MLYPPKGNSGHRPGDLTTWDRIFDGMGSVNFALDNITHFLQRNQISLKQIELFLFSQFSIKNINIIREYFQLPEEKIPFYSKELGYTGASSPFLALDKYQKEVKRLKKGDYILIWTLGTGYQAGLMHWRY